MSHYSGEEDTYDVYSEVVGLSERWSNLGLALRLLPADRGKIAVQYSNPDECLEKVLVKWLQKCYNYQKFGSPTWKMLVKAVDDPTGGNCSALAETIAKKHPGMYSVVQSACIQQFMHVSHKSKPCFYFYTVPLPSCIYS